MYQHGLNLKNFLGPQLVLALQISVEIAPLEKICTHALCKFSWSLT